MGSRGAPTPLQELLESFPRRADIIFFNLATDFAEMEGLLVFYKFPGLG